MATIVTRSGKGSPLTHAEVDANFTNLNTDKLELSGGTMTGDLSFGDSNKAIFGAGSDLQIYHDGTNSFITDVGTGALVIRGANELYLQSTASNNYFVGQSGGAATIYHNNVAKLATTSTGIDVTGSGSFSNSIAVGQTSFSGGSVVADFHTSGSGVGTQLAFANDHNTDKFFVGLEGNTTGNAFLYQQKDADINFYTNNTLRATLDNSGKVGIGTSSPSSLLTIHGSQPIITLSDPDTGSTSTISGNSGHLILNADSGSDASNNTIDFQVDNSQKMRIDSNGKVGIGTSSPSSYYSTDLVIAAPDEGGVTLVSDTTHTAYLMFADGTSGADRYRGQLSYDHNVNEMAFATNGSERMRIDSSGNVGIGISSGFGGKLDISIGTNARGYFSDNIGEVGSGNFALQVVNSAGSALKPLGFRAEDIRFATGSAERMRIDSNSLHVGRTTADSSVAGFTAQSSGVMYNAFAGRPYYVNRLSSDGDIIELAKDGTTVGSIGVTGGDILYIANPDGSDVGFNFDGDNPKINPCNGTGSGTDGVADLGWSGGRYKDLYLSGGLRGDTLTFSNLSGTEAMRIDSGNVLVGKTSASSTTAGFQTSQDGQTAINRSGTALQVGRLSTDGSIIDLRKDGSTVGSIGTVNGTLVIDGPTNNFGIGMGTGALLPRDNGSFTDNANDIGTTANRFDDIYATNGTIQTSDRNEKQDIEELTDAEQRVAVAAKGLLRKFRWKAAVAEKGDKARTHFGIIAQDLQAAFAAEGLDAGDYAMFISTTWTDEETGEERTRMGVRYSELLAFVIAAI